MKFTIKKGHHYSNGLLYKLCFYWFYKFFLGKNHYKQLQAKIKFDSSCLYELNDGIIKELEDINKLFGFSITLNHMKESARFGWRSIYPESNKIEIFSFIHHNGVFNYKKLIDVDIEKDYTYSIELNKNMNNSNFYYKFRIWDENNILILNYLSDEFKLYYKYFISFNLDFYFGGNLPSPHNMNIDFKIV